MEEVYFLFSMSMTPATIPTFEKVKVSDLAVILNENFKEHDYGPTLRCPNHLHSVQLAHETNNAKSIRVCI